MSKKIKVLIIVIAVIIVLGIAAIPLFKWCNNQEYAIVSKNFGVSIGKDADLIYFDEDDAYLHAAYGVDEDAYKTLKSEIKAAGYGEMNFDNTNIGYEWIPSGKVKIMYRLEKSGESTKDIYITEPNNGFVELYFVK